MSRRLLPLALLLCLPVTAHAEGQPRGAAVYSSFRDGAYWYREEQVAVFSAAGWQLDRYENTKIAELVAALDRYALVVFGTGYNYEQSCDLAAHAAAWRKYVEAGGCLVVTDANYPQMFTWLAAVDPALRWGCRGEMNQWREAPPAWTEAAHPLLRGVKPPNVPWTNPSYWSQAFTPLVADSARRPVVAYLELGQGVVVVSSAYRQYDFPTAGFLNNLLAWAHDPGRPAAAQRRQEAARAALQHLPEATVPLLARPPVIDGTPGEDEWRGATVLPDFVAMDGSRALTQRTVCRLAQTPYGLCLAFECYDHEVAGVRREVTERDGPVWTDDCVEVFLDPQGTRRDFLHFIVNAGGVQYDERGADPAWDRYWTARTAVAPGLWTAEIMIPFASLDLTGACPPGATWSGNFYREYPGRGGVPQELSGWSPTFAGFAATAHFGGLQGLRAPLARYPLAPEITVQAPAHWFPGDNKVSATLSALGGKPVAVVLSCADIGAQPVAGQRVVVAPGRKTSLSVTVPLQTDLPRALQLVARDAAEPERVLASSPVLRAVPTAVLELSLQSPLFRHTVQSHDPDKQLRLTGRVGDTGAVTGRLRLRAALVPEGRLRPVWQEARPVAPRSEARFETSLADLAPGRYEVQVDLQDEAQRLIARDRREVRVAGPAPVEVSFDAHRACLVNGKPIFPIGLYHVSEPALGLVNARAKELGLPQLSLQDMLTEVRDHGFNTIVRSWGMPGEEYMRQAEKLGLWVMPEIGAPDAAALGPMVAFANRYRNLLMWYGLDEPGGEKLQAALAAHERFAAADPHRPVSAACNNTGVFPDGVRAYDLLMMDPYFIFPQRNGSLETIAGWVKAGMRAGGGRVPIWVVPQAFAIDKVWAEPTAEELRCQAYLSIVHGATGLIWYAWYTTETWSQNPKGRNQWFLPDSPMWPHFKTLNAEINGLAPAILQGEARGPVAGDNEAIHSQRWELGGETTIIAVNPRAQEQSCRFTGLPGKRLEVVSEGRQLPLQGGACSDRFAPLAVHVYRVR